MATPISEGTTLVRRADNASLSLDRTHKWDIEILEERYFLRMLCSERKRTERSGKPFMLMLLAAKELFSSPPASRTIRKIAHAVAGCSRETDTLGWYEQGNVLAVLYTDIGSPELISRVVMEKVSTALRKALGTQEFDAIQVTFYVFPDESQNTPNGNRSAIFYPETSATRDSRRGSRFLKRTLDMFGSLVILVFLFPALFVIAILVRFTSDGPVLFRQTRIGQLGVPFTLYKFRSMYINNDPKIHQDYVARLIEGEGTPNQSAAVAQREVFKLTNDPRVTPMGRFLRRSSLDELPQLFNVLFGDMSLVGPRPPVPYEYERYQDWHRRRVFEVKPGITGLWQVTGRSRTTFDDMVRLDLRYARHWSLWLDLKILFKTPAAVLSGDGAY